MPKISVCIISFNEERKIRDCLESVKDIADEIVVVDSGSTDGTREIACEYTDRIIEQPFLGYVEQKNFATDQAAHDWVLAIDCDERLSDELRRSIADMKDSLVPDKVYRVSRKTFYVYRWLHHCWQPDRRVRLFHRARGRWGGVNPHDTLKSEKTETVDLSGWMWHYSFDSISSHLQTIDKFTEIGAEEAFKNGKRATIIDPITHGLGSFLKQYVLKRGFLDGFAGLAVSALSGMHSFVKYSKLRVLAINAKREQ